MLRESICGWKPALMGKQLASVTAPTLLVWGEEDKLVPPSCIPTLLAAMPNATLVTIPGAGHLSTVEQPEALNQTIRAFLEKVSPA